MNQIEAAAKQMGDIIRLVITDSNGPEKYPQAMECLGVMREELVEMEEPGFYNSFARDLKRALLSGALGGDRREFWLQMRQSKLGLISQDQSESSDIGPAEANEVRNIVRLCLRGQRLTFVDAVLHLEAVDVFRCQVLGTSLLQLLSPLLPSLRFIMQLGSSPITGWIMVELETEQGRRGQHRNAGGS